MLTDRIRLAGPESNEPEDVLGSALGVIFPDDIMNQHGDQDAGVIFMSKRFGDITLNLADPEGETSRRLFSHFLWNASLQLAEFVEEADLSSTQEEPEILEHSKIDSPPGSYWSVKDQTVLELGAGTGLAGIISAFSGARKTVLSDYPAPEVLTNIRLNVTQNVSKRSGVARTVDSSTLSSSVEGDVATSPNLDITVEGHEWGVLDTPFAASNAGAFSRLLVCDCLWMPWQHVNLHRSIAHFLTTDGRAWVIAGFHTGRAKMAGFFETEALKDAGLEVEKMYEKNADGYEREWVFDRGVEDPTERKRWLVIAILKKIGA